MKTDNLPCAVIGDLIPVDAEGLASQEAGEAISAHIAQCGACREAYIAALKRRTQGMLARENAFHSFILRLRKRGVRLALLAAALAALLGVAFFQFANRYQFAVPFEQIEWEQPRALSDGRVAIAYTVRGVRYPGMYISYGYQDAFATQTDGYAQATYTLMDKWGAGNITVRESLIVEENEVGAIYYGRNGDRSALLWQRGVTDTPPASEEMEAEIMQNSRYTARTQEALHERAEGIVALDRNLHVIYEAPEE